MKEKEKYSEKIKNKKQKNKNRYTNKNTIQFYAKFHLTASLSILCKHAILEFKGSRKLAIASFSVFFCALFYGWKRDKAVDNINISSLGEIKIKWKLDETEMNIEI